MSVRFGMLFPLDGRRRLGADVVNHPVDTPDLVDDAVGDACQEILGKPGPIRRHGIVHW